jgi:hypothetical protein
MSFKERLNEKRQTPIAIFHKFRTDNLVGTLRHVFVEGYEDQRFYAHHLNYPGGDEVRYHVCFGKKNLDDVAVLYWASNIRDTLALFIRDSDFDVFLSRAPSGKSLFLTCGYAVENYVCSAQALEAYLRTDFCLDESEFDIAQAVKDYVGIAQQFHQWLAPLYGAVFVAIAAGRKVDMNQLKVGDHFAVLLKGQDLPDPSKLPELLSMGLEESDFNLTSLQQGEEFGALPALLWMRGKFLLTVLTSYLRSKEADLLGQQKAGSLTRFNRRAVANLNERTLFDRLIGLARATPRLADCLRAGPG